MEEEEVLGVNLDELSSLFSDSSFIGENQFGWGLAPYRDVIVNDDGSMTPSGSVTLYIDAFGEANCNSKMWFFQKTDPIDAYTPPEFSRSNQFIKGLQKAVGVPLYSIITIPWYKVDERGIKEIKYPNDTPEGFVPCNGSKVQVGGVDYYVPNLISRTETTLGQGGVQSSETTFFAPPGCALMMKLPGPPDNTPNSTSLRNFGNPGNPFQTTFWGAPIYS